MLNSTEKIVFFILFFLFFVIRKYYTAKYKDKKVIKSKINIIDIVLLTLTGVAMLIPLIYVFFDVFYFADYVRPFWLSIIGICVLTIVCIILWFSHRDLSSNRTPTLGIKKEHTLVTSGIYKYIRHPKYAAHIYWAIGQIFLLSNWIAGFSLILFVTLHFLSRLKNEEGMMVEQFGAEYQSYKKNTGAIFPKIKS